MKSGPQTMIGTLANRIYQATRFLREVKGYTLAEIGIVTGGESLVQNGQKITVRDDAHRQFLPAQGKVRRERERLHKNSIMKIDDLRYTLAVRRFINGGNGKMHYVEAKSRREVGHDRKRASMQWLWSPQLDTFEKLEQLLVEAKKLGFEAEKQEPQSL